LKKISDATRKRTTEPARKSNIFNSFRVLKKAENVWMVIAFSVPALLMEGSRNYVFIIPRPRQKSKGNFDENDGNRLLCSTADFLPGACRTGGD
jgi:hypothetical protein